MFTSFTESCWITGWFMCFKCSSNHIIAPILFWKEVLFLSRMTQLSIRYCLELQFIPQTKICSSKGLSHLMNLTWDLEQMMEKATDKISMSLSNLSWNWLILTKICKTAVHQSDIWEVVHSYSMITAKEWNLRSIRDTLVYSLHIHSLSNCFCWLFISIFNNLASQFSWTMFQVYTIAHFMDVWKWLFLATLLGSPSNHYSLIVMCQY